jgi:hypothetical protein
MLLILRYWKPLLALALLALWTWGAWVQGGKSARLACAEAQLEAREAADKALRDAQRAAAEANDKLRAELAKPKPGQTIREVIRDNPTDCRVPAAVSDSVREAVNRANQAAASK